MDFEQLKMQRDVAKKAAAVLSRHRLVYLSMEMRVGKTRTAFMACEKMGYKKVFFVTKKKAVQDIIEQAETFSESFQLLCTNYEQIHNFEDFDFDPDVIIIDEAHSLGQYPKPAVRVTGHKKTKKEPEVIGMKQICEGKDIIYLSGTPTPESYSQIYHQFYVSSYSPFREYESFYKWAADYVIVTQKYMGQIKINDYSGAREEKIKEEIDHLFISKTQKEAGFNQEVVEEIITVPASAATKYLIQKLIKDRVVIGNDESVILAETEVKLQNKIHQIASGTVKLEGGDEARVFDKSKAEYIRENYKGKKIAIYYKFVAEYIAILGTFGYEALTDDPYEFQKSDDLIFVSQVQSGREGVNLSTADYIIMYNIDYSAVSYFQVRQRMQTKQREKPAMVHWLFSDTGIEQKVYDRVQGKKDYTLSYFKNDFGIKSAVVKFKSKDGKTDISIHAPTADSALFKQKMFQLMDEGRIDDVVSSLEKKYKTKLK